MWKASVRAASVSPPALSPSACYPCNPAPCAGKYLKREVLNLARFISVMKHRPLTWRLAHPYTLVDRFEDVTPRELVRANPKVCGGYGGPSSQCGQPRCGGLYW